MNLRVVTITYTTFFFINHTNLFSALSFSKTLSYLLSLTYSQITAYQKIMNDINFAHTSREIKRDKRHLKIFTTHTIWLFFTKSIYNAKESSLAMRSRGFLDG
jgi:cobalt/nickel transport system permease protein